MKSKSKYELDEPTIVRLFQQAGIFGAERVAPLGTGQYNSVYAVDAGGKGYVLKVAPADNEAVLTYETDMMRQEVFYYEKMREAGVSVPRVYFADFSRETIPADWFIMERLTGAQSDKIKLDADEKRELRRKSAEMLAKLHAVRGEGCGYLQNGLKENWFLALESMTENLIADQRRFGKTTRRGQKLLASVRRNRDILEKVEARLINFDLWPPNIFVKRGGEGLELQWIDPERCLYGDRVADFVCPEFSRMRLADKRDTLSAYNAVSDRKITGTCEEEIRFALMQGYLALITETEKYARYTRLLPGWWMDVITSALCYRSCFRTLKRLKAL